MMSLPALALVLLCVGALLHLAWLLALTLLVWVPSGYAGIVCGWYAALLSESTFAGVVVAVTVAALIRFAIFRLTAYRFSTRFIAILARQA
jgi:hypothetical protein